MAIQLISKEIDTKDMGKFIISHIQKEFKPMRFNFEPTIRKQVEDAVKMVEDQLKEDDYILHPVFADDHVYISNGHLILTVTMSETIRDSMILFRFSLTQKSEEIIEPIIFVAPRKMAEEVLSLKTFTNDSKQIAFTEGETFVSIIAQKSDIGSERIVVSGKFIQEKGVKKTGLALVESNLHTIEFSSRKEFVDLNIVDNRNFVPSAN